MRSLIRISARPWLSEGHRLADSPVACALVHERSHRYILNRDPVRLEQRDIVAVRPPTDFARDDFPDVVDAVPCEQPAFHRLDEVAALLFRLLDRVGRDESASTDRSVIELASLEAVRPDRVDVTPRVQPISLDDGLRRGRGRDCNLRLPNRFFGP